MSAHLWSRSRRTLAALLVGFHLTAPQAASVVAAVAIVAAPVYAAPEPPAAARNVIFLIPDGMGTASVTLLRDADGVPTHLDSLLVGAAVTRAENTLVTESAAAATALACGYKTRTGVVGLDAEGRPVASLLEAARDRGMATGIVVTSRLTHATPAGFASHVRDRGREDEIAAQMMTQRIDLLFGGGRSFFLPRSAGGRRLDGRDLLADARGRGVTILERREEFLKPWSLPVLGLFNADHITYEIDRDATAEPSLQEMTRRALGALAQAPNGFFLMIEGSRIDHAGHDNDAATMLHELRAFDAAVGLAVDFARHDGRTLVVSVADHETGGMTLGRLRDGRSRYDCFPGVLKSVRASGYTIAGALRESAAPESTLAAFTGLDSLAPPDLALLREGLAGDTDLLASRLNEIVSRHALVGWTTGGHTGVDVGVYAFGPGAERFRGVQENSDVAWRVAAAAGLDLTAATVRLRAAK